MVGIKACLLIADGKFELYSWRILEGVVDPILGAEKGGWKLLGDG